MRHSIWLLLCLQVLLALALPGWCGGGPAGFLVVYDQDDPDSVAVANHYQQVRGIPERCMLPVHMPTTLNNATGWALLEAIRAHITERGLAGQMQGIALAGWTPLGMPPVSNRGNISLAAILYNAPNYTDAKDFPRTDINQAFRLPPATPTICLTGLTPVSGRSYWPVSHVGPTDRVALSPRAALASIDQARAADGVKPDGVVYWPLNGDIRSLTREGEFPQVQPLWDKMGIKYSVLDGIWVKDRGDIAGGVVGIAVTDAAQDNHYLPGAWVDHLTSYGGVLLDNWQMPCTDFLLAGAAGSAGTMGEPYAIAGKFPNAHIYTHFRNGASLAESFWESIQMLNEILPVGDPLMQPYTEFPKVTISAPKANATVRGTVTIKAKAAGATLEPALDLFVDGRLVKIGDAAETVKAARTTGGFTLDTASLSDGWHELRVVAYAATAVRTQGEAILPLTVNNHRQAVRLTGPAHVNYADVNAFTIMTTNLPGAKLTLRANGRELATATAPGALSVPASAFPFTGACTVYALATLADGAMVSSAPLTVNVQWPGAPATATPALGPGVAHLRYFADTTTAGFTWEQAPTAEDTLTAAQCQNDRLTLTNKILPAAAPDWTKVDYKIRPGIEYTTWLQVPMDDVYEWRLAPGGALQVDGAEVAAEVNGLLGPLPLRAGWHQLRVRMTLGDEKFALGVLMRGGPLSKIADLPLAWCAAPATAGIPPTVTVATPAPLTGTQATLTAAGAPELTYTWTVVRAPAVGAVLHPDEPAPVTFTPNGTPGARTTTATFKAAGDYLLRVNACTDQRLGYADVAVSVKPVLTSVNIAAATGTAFVGYPIDLYATVADQFGRRMPQPPAVTWSAEPAGTFTALSGETARFRPAGAEGPCRITAAAGGKSGTFTLPVKANQPPVISALNCLPNGKNNLTLSATAKDPEERWNRGLTYQWTQQAGPDGAVLEFDTPTQSTTQAKVPAAGAYTVKLTVADLAGGIATDTYVAKLVVKDDGAVVIAPTPRLADSNTLITQQAFFSASGVTGTPTFAWESSTDNGATWQPLPDATQQILAYGPVKIEDAGRLFHVTVRNEAGAATSNPAKINVRNPAAGIIGFAQGQYVAPLDGNAVALTVHRLGRAEGKAEVECTLQPNYPATRDKRARPTEDYTETKVTLTWEKDDHTDRTITIPLVVKHGAAGRGFSAMLRVTGGECELSQVLTRIWLPGPDEPEGPKGGDVRR